MAPSSIGRDNYKIVSGSSGSLNFKQVRVDPIDRAVYFTLNAPLTPAAYKLRIKAVDDARNRLAAFDGTPFDGEIVLSFTVANGRPPQTEIDPPTTGVAATREQRACDAIGTLAGSCAGAKCHGDLKGSDPAMGLSLINYTAIKATAINRGSSLVQTPDDPAGPGRITSNFPYGLSLIASPSEGDGSARSFLLYKILMDLRDRPCPQIDKNDDPACVAENAAAKRDARELRRVIPGAPMPHDTLAPDQGSNIFAPLPWATVRSIRRWIDDGAGPCGAVPAPMDGGVDATMMETGETSVTDSTVMDTAVGDSKAPGDGG